MDLKPSMITILVLFILFLAVPCHSRGGMRAPKLDSDIYDIDYRGPETHTFARPPPNRSGAGNPNFHRKRVAAHHGSKRSRTENAVAHEKKVRG